MADHFEKQIKFYQKILEVTDSTTLVERLSEINDSSTRNYLRHLVEASVVLQKLKSEYSNEELRSIKYFRNLECHPMLTQLSVKLEKCAPDGKKTKLKNIESAKEFQKIAEREDSLETYEQLYPKFQNQKGLLKDIGQKISRMQYS